MSNIINFDVLALWADNRLLGIMADHVGANSLFEFGVYKTRLISLRFDIQREITSFYTLKGINDPFRIKLEVAYLIASIKLDTILKAVDEKIMEFDSNNRPDSSSFVIMC